MLIYLFFQTSDGLFKVFDMLPAILDEFDLVRGHCTEKRVCNLSFLILYGSSYAMFHVIDVDISLIDQTLQQIASGYTEYIRNNGS